MVIFPTLFGLYIAFTDWNLALVRPAASSTASTTLSAVVDDPFYWNALGNMVCYVLAVLVEYAIAFGLALLLNAEIRARKFFRVAFLLPLMLTPVAVSWMIGKSMHGVPLRPGRHARPLARLGQPGLLRPPWIARLTIMMMDAWIFIPFMMIMLLAGLQALPKEVLEAARVDGATPWQAFWKIIFPLMLPVSDHRDRHPHHLQAEARRHRHHRDLGRAGRRDRHGVELHLPRVPRPLECRLRHDAGDGLSGRHHRLHDAAAELRQPLEPQST